MTYNLKISTSKNVIFGAFGRSTDVNLTSGSSGNFTYALTNAQGGTGILASLSGGDVVLAQKDYIGFFVPYIANGDPVTVRILINGSSIISQQEAIKPTGVGAGSASHITRAQPLFFTYSASLGDTLRIQYSKQAGAILDMYSYTTFGGNVLILWEIDK